MPQIFQVLRCYKCLVFQVHQAKKSNKFQCKLCGEKQSIKRHYGVGTAKDCRMHVQKLNGVRGEIDELKETNNKNEDTDDDDFDETEIKVENSKPKKSKWSDFVNDAEKTTETTVQESMYLNDTEVVLEVPKKRKKHFKCPSRKPIPSYDGDNVIDTLPKTYNIQDISNMIDTHPRYEGVEIDVESNEKIGKTEKSVITKNITQTTLNENLEMKKEHALPSNINTKNTVHVHY